jgi:hypothetical protein
MSASPAVAVDGGKRADAASTALLADIGAFAAFGDRTRREVVDGIPYYINEFWTAGQRQAHAIHEISYRACFKPQLPAFFIERLTAPGEAVLDPFMGRGTTPVQAALMGRRPVGSDINPLSVLLTRPRLAPPELAAVAARLAGVSWDTPGGMPEELLAFYHPETLRHVCALRAWLQRQTPVEGPCPAPDASADAQADDWIRMVALNRLTGHSPGFFSVYTLPPNQATTAAHQVRINLARNQVPPVRDVPALILRKSKQLLRHGGPAAHPAACLATAPAHSLQYLETGSVALVVTSPPFLDIVQYANDNALRCWFAGIDAAAVAIDMHRTEAAWQDMVRTTLGELARVVRPGGHVAFEVGEVRRGTVKLERAVWRAAEGLAFERLAVMVNQQDFTKTANCWGVDNNALGTNTNRIVLLRRV